MDEEIRACKKETNFDPPAKTPLKHLPEGLPPVQHQRTFELTEEIETRFTSVTKRNLSIKKILLSE